jgi:hypothetical protein
MTYINYSSDLQLPYKAPNSYIIRLLPLAKALWYTNTQFQTLLRISASLSISYSPLLPHTRRSNNRLIANPPSLLTNDSIRITISSETVETTTVIVAEVEIAVTMEIATTTIIATRIPISPAIVIAI